MPLGCQYGISKTAEWLDESRRASERQALMLFWDATGGGAGGWYLSDNWGEGDPCWDMWYGITCDEHGHVIAIELPDNMLRGGLPGNFGSFASLLKVDLSSGPPQYNGHTNRFRNRLNGDLPSFFLAPKIEEIDISGNEFDEWPDDLWMSGSTLRVLTASHNLFTQMPAFMQRFLVLHTLEMSHNNIGGPVPSELGGLESVRYVHLDYNYFTGQIPLALTGMDRVIVFDISHNPNLGGELPTSVITSWPDCYYMSILNTSITGYIADLCIDVPMCYKFMYDTHGDMSMATSAEVPDIVTQTIALAEQAAADEEAAADGGA